MHDQLLRWSVSNIWQSVYLLELAFECCSLAFLTREFWHPNFLLRLQSGRLQKFSDFFSGCVLCVCACVYVHVCACVCVCAVSVKALATFWANGDGPHKRYCFGDTQGIYESLRLELVGCTRERRGASPRIHDDSTTSLGVCFLIKREMRHPRVCVTSHGVLDVVSYPTSHICRYILGFSLGFRETLASVSQTRKKNEKIF